MGHLLRRLTASGIAMALLLAAPGLPCYAAAAPVIAPVAGYSNLGPAANVGVAGALGTQAGVPSGIGLLPGMSFDLAAPSALPTLRSGLAPAVIPARTAQTALAAPTVSPEALRPAAAESRRADHAVPAVREEAPALKGERLQAMLARVEAMQAAPSVAGMTRTLSEEPGSVENGYAAGARTFDNKATAADSAAAPVPAATRQGWVKGLGRRLAGLIKSIDLSDREAAREVPSPEPMIPEGGPAGRAVRKGLAIAMGVGLGVGFLFTGAAVAASSPIWSPALAVAAGSGGLAAVLAAVKSRPGAKPAPARKPSMRTAALGSLGLLLLGAAGSPVLAAAVGVTTLHVSAIGLIVTLALFFEFLNGMHDAANSIATVVSTKTLSPRAAILWAAAFNMGAYFVFGAHIAATIGTGLIAPAVMSNALLVAALAGASLWNWLTIRLGIPVSSSHSLIGGLVGAALVAGGVGALVPASLIKTGMFMVLSPVIGLAAAFALMGLIIAVFRNHASTGTDRFFRGGQLLSSAMLSLGHGGNDSQKTIGIITALLFANGYLGAAFHVPWPVAVASYLAMGLGTMAGGWRIIKTLGEKVTPLDRPMGTAANVGAAASIMLATWLGIPVSTTHVVTGSVAGVGAAHGGMASVKWGVLGKIAWAWVLTIPMAAMVSGLIYLLFSFFL